VRPDAGAALTITLMVTTLLAFLGGALVFIMDVETRISANHHTAQEVHDAAEAGVNCAIAELGALADWTSVSSGAVSATLGCLDAAVPPRTPDGVPLDLSGLMSRRQADSHTRYGLAAANPDTPSWTTFLSGAIPSSSNAPRPFVLVWIADDVDDGDGKPSQDSNGTLIIRAQAFGIGGARGAVEAVVSRADGEGTQPSAVHLVVWRIGS
jgi:hypothetical protein